MILKNQQRRHPVPIRKIRRLLTHILRELGILKVDLDITFVDDPTIRRLNRKFRGIDRPTDVLSFPLWEKEEAFRDGQFLGDLVISVPTAFRQARLRNKKPFAEIAFLIVHGLLHLLGFDHETTRREALRMKRRESQLMKKAGELFPHDFKR